MDGNCGRHLERHCTCKPLRACLFLAVFWLCGAISAAAQEQRVVVLESMNVPTVLSHSRWFAKYLKEMAAADKQGVRVETCNAQGDWAKAEQLLKTALSEDRPAVVVAGAALAAQTADRLLKHTGIPLVFMTVSDPVGAGLIDAIGTAGGRHVTGIVHGIQRDTRINLLMRLVGEAIAYRPVRIGLIHSSDSSAMGDLRELLAAARGREDIVFVPYQVAYQPLSEALPAMPADVREGVRQLEEQVDVWWEPSGSLGESDEYIRMLLDHSRHPIAMGLKAKSVTLGAVMHLSPNDESTGRDVAMLVYAILKGADAGQIPARPPEKFDLGINLAAALKAGFVVPPDLLALAGPHVYH